MIPIPVAAEHTATAAGTIVKEVRCEHCGSEYVYQMARQAAGSGTSLLFLDEKRAKYRAAKRAQARLQQLLERDCDPVPCPDCGKYQAHMYRAVRRSYQLWMW